MQNGTPRTMIMYLTRGLLLLAVFVLGRPAEAQFGEAAGIAESMQAEYFNRDVWFIADKLDLDETQRMILESLFEDYQRDFDAGLERMKQRFEDMRDELVNSDQQTVLRKVFKPWEEWSAERLQIGDDFLASVQIILNEQQLDRWDQFRRELFREKNLHKGKYSGESMSLVNIVRDLELEKAYLRLVEPTIEEYELALDQALRERINVLRATQTDVIQSLQESDARLGLNALDRQIRSRLQVRDTNLRFIDVIAAALPDADAAEFRADAMEDAFPRVYRSLPIIKMYEAALRLDGLTDDQLEGVQNLFAQLQAELAPLNETLVQQILTYEPAIEKHRARIAAARMSGDTDPASQSPQRPNFAARSAVEKRYAMLLRELLGDELYHTLPYAQRWIQDLNDPRNSAESMAAPNDGKDRGSVSRQPRTPKKEAGEIKKESGATTPKGVKGTRGDR